MTGEKKSWTITEDQVQSAIALVTLAIIKAPDEELAHGSASAAGGLMFGLHKMGIFTVEQRDAHLAAAKQVYEIRLGELKAPR